MDAFIKQPEEEKRTYLKEAGSRRGLPPTSIEKDFWVCWTLRELFRLSGIGKHLVFKGGTSLSKGWNLIKRFSEDIDIVIDKGFLGFGEGNSPGDPGISASKRNKRLKKLREISRAFILEALMPRLTETFRNRLPAGLDWNLLPDTTDPQTLIFHYPRVFQQDERYLTPQVKIEMGARSDTEPVKEISPTTFLEDAIPRTISDGQFGIPAIIPERTFWEKAMLIHEEYFRPAVKRGKKSRLSRHFYDLWCLINAGYAERAVNWEGLFERTAEHRTVYFKQSWVDYSTLRKGTLRLCPAEDCVTIWADDYNDMREEMFFGTPPGFDEVLKAVGDFERGFNS